MTKNEIEIPYNADIELLSDMLSDLKNVGSEGMQLQTLWVDVGAVKNSGRSYTLNLAKFLGLVSSDNTKIWLTDLGLKLKYGTKEDKNTILVKNMPDKYLSMFKWILNSGELRSSEIKTKFIDSWGSPSSSNVFDKMIATFLSYCKWLNTIQYMGRGNQAKAIATNFGRNVLDSQLNDNTRDIPKEDGAHSKEIKLLDNATYPVTIKTNDREFKWDVKTSEDWDVIDSVIASIKKGCKIKQQSENSSNHIKGEKDSNPPT